MSTIGDYNEIMSSRTLFNEVVYTPLSQALKILEERQKDVDLVKKVEKILDEDIPTVLKEIKKCGIMARQVATPNFDTQSFVRITKDNNLNSILFEYPEDKFTSKNSFKHSLGKIIVNNGVDKNGVDIFEKINIVDHVKYDGKKIKEVLTLWEEPLIDFHRKLFKHYDLPDDLIFHDISDWYKRKGKKAVDYYSKFLTLFVTHGILFENFLISNDSEGFFTKDIVLPAIEEVIKNTGFKPLIVPIPPMDIEEEDYWISHPKIIKKIIKENI